MVSTLPDSDSLPLNSKATSSLLGDCELTHLKEEIDHLELSNLLLHNEVSSLKAKAHSYCEEVASLNHHLQKLELQALQDTPAMIVSCEVCLHYMEHHHQCMGCAIGKQGYKCIKAGDRAMHCRRPMMDAMLCLTGQMQDHEVYRDLYGVTPREMWEKMDVPEMVAMTGFQASLQSKG
jgi:hypothetical protein